jgi:hypothetical protein
MRKRIGLAAVATITAAALVAAPGATAGGSCRTSADGTQLACQGGLGGHSAPPAKDFSGGQGGRSVWTLDPASGEVITQDTMGGGGGHGDPFDTGTRTSGGGGGRATDIGGPQESFHGGGKFSGK